MPIHQRVQQVGYKRVSTAAQNDARQLDGVTLDKTFEEAVSAKTAHLRPKLREAWTTAEQATPSTSTASTAWHVTCVTCSISFQSFGIRA